MKTKGLAILLTIVLLLSCCPLWAAAEEADPAPASAEAAGFAALPFLDYDGCTTTITDIEGVSFTFGGCLDVTALEEDPCCENIASYSIYLDGNLLLEVTLHDILTEGSVSLQGSQPQANGYYSIEFDLDGDQEAFLTGLTPENLAKAQEDILDAKLKGQDVSIEDIDFIDTEKHLSVENLNHEADTDTLLCWAASTSNILHYTGWGQQAGFGSTDYLFDLFTTRFGDDGSNPYYGIPWFFNGYYAAQEGGPGWAPVDDGSYGTFRGYLPQYPAETVLTFLEMTNDREKLALGAEALRTGCGAGLSIAFYTKDKEPAGGHAITLWGYVRDKNDPDGFSYLVISDSDNDKMGQVDDRRSAPNTLQAVGLTTSALLGGESWALSDYDTGDDTAILNELNLLAPYSEDLPRETEGDGNRFAHPDLTVTELGVDACEGSRLWSRTVLPAGQELFFQFKAVNNSEITAEAFDYQVQIEKDGISQDPVTGSFSEALRPGRETWMSDSIGSLEAGEYTITCTVNPGKSFTEANYLNNTKTVSFTVVDSAPVGALAVNLGDMGAREDGSIGATAELTRPADCPADAVRYFLYTAYGNAETTKTGCTLRYSGSTFPTELFTERNNYYSHVFYRVLVKSGDPSRPWLEYLSGPVAQRYRYIQAYADEGNVFDLSAVPQGSTAYAEGERTCFAFYNGAEVPGSLAFDWALRAVGETGGEYCLAMDQGELERAEFLYPEPNTSLIVLDPETGEEKGPLPPDRYKLYAESYYKNLKDQDETYSAYVGTITVTVASAEDLPRLTTGEASEVYRTSATVSASAQVEAGTTARLGVEFSTDADFTLSAVHWFTEDFVECGSGVLSYEEECRPLLPERKYHYRAVLEVQEDESVTVYQAEDVKTLTTNRPDVLETLTLEETLTFTPVESDWSYVVFTAPESGWYQLTASDAFGLDFFVEGDDTWYSGEEDYIYFQDGEAAFTCRVPAGRQMCASIYSMDGAACTVTVSEAPDTAYSVDVPTLTESGDGTFRASVSAAVPLGSSFTLRVEYGPDENSLTTASKDFSDWREDSAQASFTLDCLPGRTYLYRGFVQDADTGKTVYSGDFQTVTVPPFDGEALTEGTQTLTLARNEVRSWYSFTAETAGDYTFRADGPDGAFTYWDGGWKQEQFSLNGFAVTAPLAVGETAYFTVKGWLPGEYRISYSFTGDSRLCDKNGFGRSFTADQNGLCFAAAYDTHGKMLAVEQETVTAGERCTVFMPYQTGIACMKVFQVSETLAPLCEPAVIQ